MIYLDNSATTRPKETVVRASMEMMTACFGNPSAKCSLGVEAEKKVKKAREQVAKLFHAQPDCIVFTGSGTEADNIAILGGVNGKVGRHLITTAVEHPAALRCFEHLEKNGFCVTYLPPGEDGSVPLEGLEQALRPDTALVSIMHVNNETGAMMPIEKMKPLIRRIAPRALFHVDAVQSFGKVALYPEKWGVDLMSASAHKIHGPKGVGALYIRKGLHLRPVVFGGGQENGVRSGTENTAAIVGFGAAAELADLGAYERVKNLKERLFAGILPLGQVHCNGTEEGFAYILNVSFGGIRSEILLNALSAEDICVSAGSACASSKTGGSHVLRAMKAKGADNAIRFSFSEENTVEEMDKVVEVLQRIVPKLR